MKRVLIIAPYIFHENIKDFQKNKSGLGRIIASICKEISKGFEVYLVTNTITCETHVDGYTVCSHTKKDILRAINPVEIKGYLKSFCIKNNFQDRLKYVYYYINHLYVRRLIKKICPDFVLVHGFFYFTNLCIDYCIKNNVPFSVCLHGEINNEKNINANNYLKKSEGVYLRKFNQLNITTCVIGTGIKRDLCVQYNLNPKQIAVISNGVDITDYKCFPIDLRSRFALNNEDKILLYVSSLNPNKNHMLLLDLMKNNANLNLVVLIIGDGEWNYKDKIRKTIIEYGLEKKIYMVGGIEKRELINYYKAADYNILLSYYEGFGLSIAEGYCFGVPALTFSDLGAVEDLYDECCMVKIESRAFEEVNKAFIHFLSREWDKKSIISFSKKFTISSMGQKYREFINSQIINKLQ